MGEVGKIFIVFGIIFILVGVLLTVNFKIPFLGRLPGDILIRKQNFTFYFPIGTSIMLSVIISILFIVFGKR